LDVCRTQGGPKCGPKGRPRYAFVKPIRQRRRIARKERKRFERNGGIPRRPPTTAPTLLLPRASHLHDLSLHQLQLQYTPRMFEYLLSGMWYFVLLYS
jgi:hypothetical protein